LCDSHVERKVARFPGATPVRTAVAGDYGRETPTVIDVPANDDRPPDARESPQCPADDDRDRHLTGGAAGIETDADGFVETDEHHRTTADGVWALGDVVGE